jgi:hypothetical protein
MQLISSTEILVVPKVTYRLLYDNLVPFPSAISFYYLPEMNCIIFATGLRKPRRLE